MLTWLGPERDEKNVMGEKEDENNVKGKPIRDEEREKEKDRIF